MAAAIECADTPNRAPKVAAVSRCCFGVRDCLPVLVTDSSAKDLTTDSAICAADMWRRWRFPAKAISIASASTPSNTRAGQSMRSVLVAE